jgi:hypothetical protein
VVKETVKVKPVAPTIAELGTNAATDMRAGVSPVMYPSYLTALAFPVLSTRNACSPCTSLVVGGLIKFPIWIVAVLRVVEVTCSLTETC